MRHEKDDTSGQVVECDGLQGVEVDETVHTVSGWLVGELVDRQSSCMKSG